MSFDQEQTWPNEDDFEKPQHQIKKRVPKGTSEYQAAWIVSDEDDDDNDQDGDNNRNQNEDNQSNVCFSIKFNLKKNISLL